jgi:DNA topoisomerase-1
MRTDSVRISDDAINASREFVVENYGEKYYPETPNNYVKAGKKNVQDAHEAIRPSYPSRTPESIKKYLTNEAVLHLLSINLLFLHRINGIIS